MKYHLLIESLMLKKINIFNLIKLARKNKPLKLGIVNMWRPKIITKKGDKNANSNILTNK